MNNLNCYQILHMLLKIGLTIPEIGRLVRLRGKYAASELDQAHLKQYHLEFARWLVIHHRLTEQLEANRPTRV